MSFEAGPMALAYVEGAEFSWPLLVDESRSLYEAYDMERGSWWDIRGPVSWVAYTKLSARGRRLQ